MEQIIPRQERVTVIEPFYPKPERAGRRPIGTERMLRIRFPQHGFSLSGPGGRKGLV